MINKEQLRAKAQINFMRREAEQAAIASGHSKERWSPYVKGFK